MRANAAVHLKDLLASTADEHKWEANNVFSSSQAEDMGGVVETLQAVATGACNAQVEGVDARSESSVLV